MDDQPGFGLYVHWPFCQAKCPYCDFNSHVSLKIDHSAWVSAYLSEIKRLGAETEGRVLDSVFFGGGTPSLMAPETVDAILREAKSVWKPSNDMEITLETTDASFFGFDFGQLVCRCGFVQGIDGWRGKIGAHPNRRSNPGRDGFESGLYRNDHWIGSDLWFDA